MEVHSLAVRRTARYATLGLLGPDTRRIWFVLHGYGQLAEHFIRRFDILLDGQTYVVAPEALSRFYLDGPGAHARVGASWMTREERLHEIDDYLFYLNTLYQTIISSADAERVSVGVLGFSQGTATLGRWVASSQLPFQKAVLWGGGYPQDLTHFPYWERLKTFDQVLIYGDQDSYMTPAAVEKQRAEIQALGLRPAVVRFPGKHEIVRELVPQVCRMP